MNRGRLQRTVDLPAPPGDVWRALTEQLSAWFGAEVSIDLRRSGRAEFRWPDGTVRPAVVEEVEPARALAFRWLAFAKRADGSVIPLPATRVELTLEATKAGTRLRVVESGFAAEVLA